jgi:hypothetical protein
MPSQHTICSSSANVKHSLDTLKPSGYSMYRMLHHPQTLRSAHRAYLCVPYGSHNKQRLVPQTALTGWAL